MYDITKQKLNETKIIAQIESQVSHLLRMYNNEELKNKIIELAQEWFFNGLIIELPHNEKTTNMMIINKPEEIKELQCFKCKSILLAHSYSNINSDYFTNCELHRKTNYEHELIRGMHELVDKCEHQDDGNCYLSNPSKVKCIKCGVFYR